MKSLYDVTLAPPTFPQADETGTINVHDIRATKNKYIIMKVDKYAGDEVGDKITGYLCFNGNCLNNEDGTVLKSLPYYITPDVLDVPSYTLLFLVDEVFVYGAFQGHYEITSNENVRESPIVNITLASLDTSSLPEYAPSAPDATGNNGTLLTKDDYYRLDQLRIDVPVYDGMAPGQIVNVIWKGRNNTYITPTQTVNEVMLMTFYIPRMEFIDTIGYTAQVQFKVEKLVSDSAVYSGTLHLDIGKQNINLPAPTLFYRDDGTIHVMIEYSGMSFDQTVEIRAVGRTMLQTDYKQVDDQNQMAVPLPTDWIEENRGHLVLIDYAVGSMYPGREYSFSRVLRQIL
ncbi:hypothetical protein [Xenorhabdus sp. SGI246]|uniref:hypothetical protein n=1 Tax=Xenorhabdus sp. SGI246 TaxID=3158263 RepID=UPI00349F21EF